LWARREAGAFKMFDERRGQKRRDEDKSFVGFERGYFLVDDGERFAAAFERWTDIEGAKLFRAHDLLVAEGSTFDKVSNMENFSRAFTA